jgi:autotransporter-associated beta strand protein
MNRHTLRRKPVPNVRSAVRKHILAGSVALLAAVLLPTAEVNAATYYWDADGTATGDNAILGTNLGGAGTWDTSSLLWFNSLTGTDVAWPNLATDTAVFTGTAGVVTLVGGGVNTGALQFFTTGYTLGGGQLTLGAAGTNLFVNTGVTTTINSVIGGANGLGVYGGGTLNLSAVNQFTGNTSVSNGATLNLDFTTNSTDLIQNTSALVFNGGKLTLAGFSGATDSQTFAGTSVAGSGVITLNQNSAASLTVALGVITQTAGGSLNFSVVPLTTGVIATTSNANVSGILGPWASVGSGTGTNFRYATVNGSNQIVAYSGGTAAATAAALTDTTGVVNYDLAVATGTVPATSSSNTIRFTGPAATTAPGATLFSVNGLMNAGTGLWTIGTNNITIGANKDLQIITGTNGITITSVIVNNAGGASSLTYSGTGTLTLSKANLYTGTTTVNSGTLNLGLAAALNSASSLVVNGGTFGEVTFADTVASVTLKSGSITGTTGALTSTAAFDLQSGTITALLAGTAGLNKTTPGTVTFSNTSSGTLTGGVNVKAGTLIMGSTGAAIVPFAAGNTITLGDSSGSADARLAVQSTAVTYANPIVLGATTGNLSIGNLGASNISFTNATGITGSHDLILGNTAAGTLTFANVNNTGAVTNLGSGTGATIITLLGGTVTALNQAGASPLTLTPAYPVSQLGFTIASNGTGLFTLSNGVAAGAGSLVFNANSSGGITSTTGILTTGTLTNSGTGAGTVTITGAIGATVTNVLQNSATSALTLSSAANAYTGTTTVTQGTLNFAGTPVTGATSGLGNSATNIVLGGASTLGKLVYTGATATMTRNFTINAGGGEIDSTAALPLTLLPGAAIDLTTGPLTLGTGATATSTYITVGSATTATNLFTGANTLTKVGGGIVSLSTLGGTAVSTAAMPIVISAGTLSFITTNVQTNNILGTGLITIATGATLTGSFTGNTTSTQSNSITITGASGTATIQSTSGAVNFSNAASTITFAAGTTSATILKLNNTNATAATMNFSGTVSGTGNIQFNPSAAGSPITLAGPQNQIGTISNVGTSTSASTIAATATIGAGISAISQAGANPFTVAAAIPLSAGLNSFTSTGAGLFTFSGGFTGAQPLTFNANSTGAIAVTTAAVANAGTITNSGTGGGTTTISSNITSPVTNVIESAAASALILSGTNTYTGTSTATAGVLSFTTTLAIPGYSTSPATAFGTFGSPKMSASPGATIAFPFGAATNAITNADIANFSNGTYGIFAAGSSLGIDTTNAAPSPANLTAIIADTTVGALGFTKMGTNALTVNPANTYTGPTMVANGTLNAVAINNVGAASGPLGAPTTVANGTISLGFGTSTGTLSYTGAGETTNRVFNLAGTTGGGGIDNSGTGPLTIANPVTFTGLGAKTFTVSGAGNISFSSAIGTANNFSTGTVPLTIAKTGTGTVTLSGANSAQNITISGGTLDTGAGGIILSNLGTANVAATGTSTINGTIFLGATAGAANGPDYNASAGTILTLNAVIANGASASENIDFNSAAGGTVILAGANTFNGQVQINGAGTLQVSSFNSVIGGTASSSLGAPVTAANGTILLNSNGIIKYTGSGETTDRVISLSGTTTGGMIDQSGTGLLKFSSNFATPGAGIKTFVLQGSTAGTGEIAGAITQNTTTNTTTVTKNGTGTWTLSGVNTYTGATNVNGGNLILSQGAGTGVLSNTGIVINSGGTLSPLGGTAGYFAGNTVTALRGASVTLNAGGTLNLADGTVNSFALIQEATFVGNAATFNGGSLVFDIGTSTADQIDVRLGNVAGTGLATSTGANSVAITPATGTASLTPGNYVLINAAGSLSNANFYLASPNLFVGGTLYNLSLSLIGTNEVLTVATGGAAAAPATAYWNGTTNASWAYQPGGAGTATNWSAAAAGTPDTFALPTGATNVIMTANSALNLLTTLDQAFTVNSLTFTGAGTANAAGSTIASGTGTNALTINAAALNGNVAGNGISVSATSGPDTISANVILGASQTWTNNSATSLLTISGAVSDGGSNLNLTTAGAGTVFLSSAASTYGGITTIGAGTLRVGTLANGGLPSSIGQSSSAPGNLVFSAATTLQYSGGSVVTDRAFTIPAGVTATINVSSAAATLELAGATGAVTTGTLTKVGLGALSLNGAQTYTGNTLVNAGTLNITGTGSLTGLAASTKLNINPTAGNNGVVNYTSSGTSTLFAVTGATVAGTASAFNQSNGVVNITPGVTTGTQNVAIGIGSYGYYNITGGIFHDTTGTTGGARFTVSSSGGTAPIGSGMTGAGVISAVVNVGGTGYIDHTNAEWWLNYGLGQVTVTDSGKIDHTGSNQPFAIFMDSTVTGGSYGVLNLAGANAQVIVGSSSLRFGNSTTNGSGNSGFINLASGTFSLAANASTSLNAAGANGIYFNFAGGTLKSLAALTQFSPTSNAAATVINTIYGAINNSAVAGAPSFNGGLTIDTTGGTVTIPANLPLLGAAGNRVTQADLTVNGGSGYIGAPAVIFSKPASASGVPASGYALMSGGSVVGIVITDPGVYGSETPTITLVGGGAAVPATVTSGLLATANSSISPGGLTKVGTGILLISGTANTFTGPVDIKAGQINVTTLGLGGAASTLGASSNAASNLLLDGGILGYTGTVAGTTDRNFTLAATTGGLDASGTTLGTFTLTAANAMTVAPGLGAATLTLQGTGTGATGAGSIGTLLADGTGTTLGVAKLGAGTWNVTNVGNSYTGPTVLSAGILSVGKLDNGGASSSIGASTNAAGNLVFSGGTLQYTGAGVATDRNYTFGNATTASGGGFDTTGATGPLVISGSMTGVNTAANTQVLTLTSLAASGANALNGAISDSGATALTGVTKSGVGAWTLGGANAYSGLTTVNAGTLNITGTNTLASPITFTSGGNGIVNINSSGTVAAGAINWAGATGGVLNLLGGTLLVNAGGLTSTSATVNALVFNGGTLKSSAPFAISATLNINFQAGGGTIDTTGGNITSASSIANTASPGTLNITGGNTLQSPMSATMTGPVNITGAGTTFQLVTTAGAAYPGLWTIGSGANLDINNLGNFSFGGLAGGGTILNTGASAVRTITITGTGGNTFSGSIQQPTPSTTQATGVTLNLTSSSATQALSGVNTYGGPTTILQGTLVFNGGSMANTAISVAAGGSFAVRPGSGSLTAGNALTAGQGASLNLPAGAVFSMVDATIGTFNLVQEATFATPALTLASGNLNLDLSALGADQMIVSGGTVSSAISGTNTVTFTTFGSNLTPGTYPILTAPGIAAANTLFKFGNGLQTDTLTVGGFTYPVSLTSVTGIEQITVGAGIANLTWTGLTNGNGVPNSVWIATASGNNNFANTTPAAVDYFDGASIFFNDLNAITAANVTNGTVTIDAAGVNPGAVTVNNNAVSYTFQNAGGTIGIAGAIGITKTGPGTLTLLGANTFTGGIAINGGIVNVGVAEGAGFGPLGNGGAITFAGGTLQFSAANANDYSARFSGAGSQAYKVDTNGQTVTFASPLTSGGGTLTKEGAGTLIIANNLNTYTGATVVNGGTLRITVANGATGAIVSPTITINNGATLETTFTDALGFTLSRNALIINGGTVLNNAAGTRDTLFNTVTMTGGFLAGTSLGDSNTGAYSLNSATSVIATSDAAGNPATISANVSTQAVGLFQVTRGTGAVAPGAPDLLISGPITPYAATTNGITIRGSGIVNLTGANTYKGSTTILGGTLGGIVNANSTQALSNNLAGLILGDTTGLSGTLNVNESNSVTSLNVNTVGASTINNTITIAPTKTLTVTGNVAIGPAATATNQFSKLTIGGGGTFAVATAAAGTFRVGGNPTSTNSENATLDLTGLVATTINVSNTGTFAVGNTTTTNVAGNQGTLLLPTPTTGITPTTPVTTITAQNLNVGDGGGLGSGAGQINSMILGTGLTTLNVNTVNIGTGIRDLGSVTFASGNGTVILRAANGTGRAAVNIGTGTATTGVAVGSGTTGSLIDLTGHNADLLISTLLIGSQYRNVAMTSAFTFDTGTLDATGVQIGFLPAPGGTQAAITLTDTLNIAGGTVIIGASGLDMGTTTATAGTVNKTIIATVNISGGTVTIANNATIGAAVRMVNTLASNGNSMVDTLNITGSASVTLAGDIIKGSTTGTGTSTATLNLNGATALLDMSGGGVVHHIGSATKNIDTFTYTNGTLQNIGTVFGNITLAGTGSRLFQQNGSFSGQVNGVISGSGIGLNKAGTGTIALLGANTFSGNVDIVGTLVANFSNATLNPVSSALGNPQVARNINVNNGGTLQFSNGDTFGNSTSTVVATLVINTGGIVTTDATGWFNTLGAVQLNGGTLTGLKGASNPLAQMYSLLGAVTVNGNATNAPSTISGPAAGGSTFGGYHLAANTLFNVADATLDANADLVVSGTLIDRTNSLGAGGLTKTGAGTMSLSGLNTYTGPTSINSGTVNASTVGTGAAAQSLGAGTTVNLGVAATASGTLNYTGAAATLDKTINALGNGTDTVRNSGTGLLTLAGTINKNGTTLTLNGGAQGIAVTGQIQGGNANSDLTVTNGTTTLSNTASYNGATTVTSTGTLAVVAGGSLTGTKQVNVNDGGMLLLNVSGGGNLLNAGAAVTVGGGTSGVLSMQGVSGSTGTLAGALSLNSNSTINFGTGDSNQMTFASLLSLGGTNITISHWTGSPYAGGAGIPDLAGPTQDRLLFSSGLGTTYTDGQAFTQITFTDDAGAVLGYGQAIAYGTPGGFEIVPVPEPATTALLGAVALSALIGCRKRRRSTGIRLARQ